MPITVRPATRDDAATICRVNRAAWRAGYADILSDAELDRLQDDETGYTAADYERLITADGNHCLVAVDEAVIGYCAVTPGDDRDYVEDGEQHLQSLYVHPDHWRRGAGSTLLDRVVELLDAPRLKTEVLRENDRGIAFYEAHGFEKTGERTIGPDQIATLLENHPTVVMAKPL